MICINVTKVDGKINQLTIKGHSGSAPKGKDIICSAVSAISQGGCNALENPKCFAFKCEDGLLDIKVIHEASIHDYQVLDTILIQLKSVEEVSKDFVKIVEKGN